MVSHCTLTDTLNNVGVSENYSHRLQTCSLHATPIPSLTSYV